MPTDPWLLVSSVGFVASLALWFALLKKFRQSGQLAADMAAEAAIVADKIEPIPVKTEAMATSTVSSIKEPPSDATIKVAPPLPAAEPTLKMIAPVQREPEPLPKPAPQSESPAAQPSAEPLPAPVPAPAPASEPSPAKPVLPSAAPVPNLRSGQTLTGGISPAVVYLQNLKEQLEGLRKEVQSVKTQMTGISQKSESQFGEILRRLDDMRGGIPASASPPAPAAASVAPSPAPVVIAPAPAAYAPPDLGLQAPSGAPAGGESATQAQAASAPEPRKGPVWPT